MIPLIGGLGSPGLRDSPLGGRFSPLSYPCYNKDMKKTKDNPYGLTGKQLLVVEDMIEKVKAGKSIDPIESTKKVYNVSTHDSAKTITYRNLNNPDIRRALIEGFHEKNIIGANSRVEQRLDEGLDATDKDGSVDYANRLKYIQEINKIVDVYAPKRVEKKTMTLNLDLSEEELDKKIKDLQDELEAH